MFTIQVADNGYQLVGPNGEESGVTEYGDVADVEVDGKTYEVCVEDKESAMTEETELYLCMDEVPAVEEVGEFELEEGEEEDEEDDEDEEVPA
jgi:hypothetical protein